MIKDSISKTHILLFLSFLSGITGLAYEVIYFRLFSSYIGNIFYISLATLFSFFLGIGIGSIVSRKFRKYLWLSEIGIGFYAVFILILFTFFSQKIILLLYSLFEILGPIFLTLISVVLLLPAGILIGLSIPLYTYYLSKISNESNSYFSFKNIYIYYNLGAAICVLLIEFFFIRTLGYTLSLLIISIISIITGLLLYVFIPRFENTHKSIKISLNKKNSNLFILNILTSLYYILLLKTMSLIFGPLNENFAILLVLTLFSISIGTIIVSKFTFSYQNAIYLCSVITLITFALLGEFIHIWSYSQNILNLNFNLFFLKTLFIVVFSLPLFILFGVIEPLFLKKYKDVGVDEVMAISSFAMALGFFVTTFILSQYFNLFTLIVLSSLIFFVVYLSESNFIMKISKKKMFLGGIFILSIIFISLNWVGSSLYIGNSVFSDQEYFKKSVESLEDVELYKQYNEIIAIPRYDYGTQRLVINGHATIVFTQANMTPVKESESGLVGLNFIENKTQSNVLVKGLGAGITAGAISEVAQSVRVSEINPVIFQIQEKFSKQNFNILKKNNTELLNEDAYVTLLKSNETYDLIVNTVPSPYFNSASKLWTKEVINISSQRLTKNGVYVAWLNGKILDSGGFETMVKTYNQVFDECIYYPLSLSYYQIICSNSELKYYEFEEEDISKNIRKLFTIVDVENTSQLNDYFYYKFFKLNESKFLEDDLIKINSLNFPILEFQTPYSFQPTNQYYAYIYSTLYSDFNTNIFTNSTLNQSEMNKKCQVYKKSNIYFANKPTHIC